MSKFNILEMENVKVGDRVYNWNFRHWGTVTSVASDSLDIIVDYKDDTGENHKVYAYMLQSTE